MGPIGVREPSGSTGATGPQGSTGPTGAVSLVVHLPVATGSACSYGGTEFESGLDTNGNHQLDAAEITAISFVCNGQPGASGATGITSLINVTPEAAGLHCANGGERIDVGLDENADMVLEGSEIEKVAYVCNGATRTSDDAGAPDSGGFDGTAGGDADASGSDSSPPSSPAPSIVKNGQAGHLLLRGTIVTPDQVFQGELLIGGDIIECVAVSCAAAANADSATIVETNGIIFPGLIDTNNHAVFDIFDETDWTPTQAYTNHTQLTDDPEPRYLAMLGAKQYLNGEKGSSVALGCELDKYGEIKGLIAGTTSVVANSDPSRPCSGTLARTIDTPANGLGPDKIQVATLLPTRSPAHTACNNIADGKTDA